MIRAYDPAAHAKGCDCPTCCQAAKDAAGLSTFPAVAGPTAAGCFVPQVNGIEIPPGGLTVHTEARWLNADGSTSPILPASGATA